MKETNWKPTKILVSTKYDIFKKGTNGAYVGECVRHGDGSCSVHFFTNLRSTGRASFEELSKKYVLVRVG